MISVIIPVYNGEQFVGRCVESILEQTYEDFELILVDDGSQDRTGSICDEYAKKDNRVKVIHQKNGGVSRARNQGLQKATGDYITFVDADDYLLPQALETLMDTIGDAQILMYDLITTWPDGTTAPDTIPLLEQDCDLTKEDLVPNLLLQMAGSACRCLYKQALLDGVTFPVGIKLSEDRLFNLAAMGKCEKLRYLKKGLYIRTMREGSACLSYHADYFDNSIKAAAVARETLGKYWSEAYFPAYQRLLLLDGAMMAVYQIAGKSFVGKGRLKAIKRITSNETLCSAFYQCPPQGIREKLLKWKANIPLLMVGYLWNMKNGS